ncbi:T9SS type B sorting domain-containing protein [Flavobacterium coralii]|uniref:T9SS type B sorting domain-containing protein n=1 Tax=Flavobacterium coralii TaxID=2838017 RepID=UPI001CA70831|nr:T9SS type B sorting domain-containing protein [Flavobacterium coralii]
MFFFAFMLPVAFYGQVYQHNFGNTVITNNPYTGTPNILNPNLSGSSWTNNTGNWLNINGASNSIALSVTSPNAGTTPTTQITLTFNVAAGKQLDITSFNFWRKRSPSAAQTWNLFINGTQVGNGSVPTTGASTGNTAVSTPVTGLTGTVTVTVSFNNSPTGSGNVVLDDFTLNGVISNASAPLCPVDVTSYTPVSGPENTLVTLTGTGFNEATSVTFDGITSTFAALSDTELIALVPEGASTGVIVVNGSGCNDTAGSFTVLASECESDVYISEIFDAYNGVPGAIELYNPTSNPINLNGYTLLRYGDIGIGPPSYNMSLTGTIAPGDTFIVAIQITTACPGIPTDFPLTNGINANDEFELLKNGTLIDNVEIPLGSGDLSGRGYTLIRKPDAIAPKVQFNVNDWFVYGEEFCTDLDQHTANPVSAPTPDFTGPASEYICENEDASFTVVPPGTGYTYQWRVLNSAGNWVNVTNGTNYSGATTATLNVLDAPFSFNGNQYYCVLTSTTCELISNAAQLNITEAPDAAQVNVTQPGCASATGSITVTAPLEFGLSYSINSSTYQFTTTFNNLAPGTYPLTVKNLSGCISEPVNITIINSATPAQAVATVTQPTCTTATGTIAITSPTGTGLQYSIGGAYQSSAVFSGLTPNTYSVTVQNAQGCISTPVSVTVNPAPAAPAQAVATVTQPTCTTATGTITITSPTGTGLQYSIGGAYQTSAVFSGLTPNTYNVTVQNAQGCISTPLSVTVNPAPAAPAQAVATVTQPTCTTATGTITITSPTGTGLQYSIGGAYQSSVVFNGLAPNTYNVTVQNADGCISAPVNITVNPAPAAPAQAVATVTQPTCTTVTGTITITSPTGTGLQYSIGGAYQSSPIFSGLVPNTYNVTVQNAQGCISTPVSVTVNPAPAAPAQAVATVTQPTCTSATGTITITSPTGTGLQYSIGGAYQSSAIFSGLAPNTYSVTVQNSDGCISTPASVTVNPAPAAPAQAVATVTQPTCTTATGTITITSPTGTGLQYSIGGAYQSSAIFTGLAPNTYSVTVQNAQGCISTPVSVTVNPAPAAPVQAVTNVTQPTCTTVTGTITITSPTGTGLQYSIGGAYQTSPVFSGLTPNTYSVTVQNSDGCISTPVSVTVNPAPAAPAQAVSTITQPTCTTATGTITITSPTGTGLQYSIGGAYQSSPVFSGLTPNTYNVTVQNSDGCMSTPVSFTVNPAPGIAQPTYSVTALGCDDTTGAITFNSPTGAGTLYSIDGGTTFVPQAEFNGLVPDNYSLVVQNAEGCTSQPISVTIAPAPAIPADAIVTAVQPTCTTPFGSLTVTAPTGTGLTYSINGINYQSSTLFSGLTPGTYSVFVKNSAGCISENPATATINAAPAVPQQAGYTQTNPTCTNPFGSITITSPVGTGLEYSINNGSTYSNSNIFTNLTPGQYQLVVRNQSGCTSAPVNVTITTVPNIPADAVVLANQPSCGSTTGSITVLSPTGAGIQYSINGINYQSSATFTGLAPATYNVYVRNAAGCISANPTPVTINLAPQTPGVPVADVVNPDCTTTTGSITVTSPTGTGLQYSIDNGATYQTSNEFTNLTPGSYVIRVQNADGCVSLPVTKVVPPQPSFPALPVVTALQPDCDNPFGKIEVNSPRGPGFSYSIDSGVTYQANATFPDVVPGTYIITVRNAAGCTEDSEPITINNPPAPAPDPGIITGNGTICAGDTTQLENLVLDGIWTSSNDNIATVDENGLVTSITDGTVTISYTVGAECTASAEFTVNVIALPEPELEDIYYLCRDLETGENNAIIINTGLPLGVNSFVWTKDGETLPNTTNTLIVIEPGDYTVTVTNANGCTASAEATVRVSSPAVATAIVETDFQFRQTITVDVTGGSGDYEYSLNGRPFQDDNVFTGITEGFYTIIVNDKNGCNPVVLEVYALDYPRFFSPNGDGIRDTWNIKGLSGQDNAIIYIFDRYGKVVSVVKPGANGWDGSFNGEQLPATDYWFKLLYTSSDGSNREFKAHFSLLR